jgi:hypothetical protein
MIQNMHRNRMKELYFKVLAAFGGIFLCTESIFIKSDKGPYNLYIFYLLYFFLLSTQSNL